MHLNLRIDHSNLMHSNFLDKLSKNLFNFIIEKFYFPAKFFKQLYNNLCKKAALKYDKD